MGSRAGMPLTGSGRVSPWFVALALFVTALSQCISTYAAETPADEQAALRALSLEELSTMKVQTVYGASKFEQSLSEAPSAVSIVTSTDIKEFGYRTLADVLRSVRGFDVSYDRNYGYIGVR